MRKVKWIFFAYLGLVALIICGVGLSFTLVPPRDPTTLYGAYLSNMRSFDPTKITDVPTSLVAGHIYECLYNYQYEKRPFTLLPELAKALPEISPDNKTWTIRLRKGVHFFDPNSKIPGWEDVKDDKGVVVGRRGPEVTSADFIYAWKRIANFHVESPQYANIFQGKIVGLDEWWDYTKKTPVNQIDWDRPVLGLLAPDPGTLIIKFVDPFPQFVYLLAHLPTAPIAREAIKFYGDEYRNNPIATGPYALPAREYRQDERIIMTANPIYRGRSDIDGDAQIPESEKLPYIKRIRWDYFQEDLPAWALFQQGMTDASTIPKDAFEVAIDKKTQDLRPEQKAKGIKITKYTEPVVFFVGFNMEDRLFAGNKPLRQAMSMALNRQRFIDLMWNGRGIICKGPIAPEFPLYEATHDNPNCDFNVSAAKEKMKEAIRLNGGPIPTIPMLFPGSETFYTQMGELMKQDMGAIGVEIKPDYRTFARFQEMVDSRQAQFFDIGWQADYPDEQTFLLLFYSKNRSPGPNNSNYNNPAYDALYEKASVMDRSPARDELYRQMIKIVQEDCPVIFSCARINYALNYDWISNAVPNEYAHGNRAHWRLDQALRIEQQRRH